jgi:hypothetical protein
MSLNNTNNGGRRAINETVKGVIAPYSKPKGVDKQPLTEAKENLGIIIEGLGKYSGKGADAVIEHIKKAQGAIDALAK